MPVNSEKYALFEKRKRRIQYRVQQEMNLAFDRQLTPYQKDLIGNDMGYQGRRIFRDPKNLWAWTRLSKNINESELVELAKRIERFAMLQGSMPFQPEGWLDVFTNDINEPLREKLKALQDALQSGEWLNFDSDIMRDAKLGVYALMLFTLDKINLDQYTDLCRVVQLSREYPPIYTKVEIFTADGELSSEFIEYLKVSGEGFFTDSPEDLANIKQILQDYQNQQQELQKHQNLPQTLQMVKVYCPDYTERRMECMLAHLEGKQYINGYYYFPPMEIHDRILFSRFGEDYPPMFPVQGTMSSYGFISLQRLFGLRPVSVFSRAVEEVVWIHTSPSGTTAITDHDMFFHRSYMSLYGNECVNEIFSLVKWLERNEYYRYPNITKSLNIICDFSVDNPNLDNIINHAHLHLPITVFLLMYLSKDENIKNSRIYTPFEKRLGHSAKFVHETLTKYNLIKSEMPLMKQAIILSFYYAFAIFAEGRYFNLSGINVDHGDEFPKDTLLISFARFIDEFHDQLNNLQFTFDPANHTYKVIYSAASNGDIFFREIMSSSYENYDMFERCGLFNLVKTVNANANKGFISNSDLYDQTIESYLDIEEILLDDGIAEPFEILLAKFFNMNPGPNLEDYVLLQRLSENPEIVTDLIIYTYENSESNENNENEKNIIKLLYELNPSCIELERDRIEELLTAADQNQLDAGDIKYACAFVIIASSCIKDGYVNDLIEKNPDLQSPILTCLINCNYINPAVRDECIETIMNKLTLSQQDIDHLVANANKNDLKPFIYILMREKNKDIKLPELSIVHLLSFWIKGGTKNDDIKFQDDFTKLIKNLLDADNPDLPTLLRSPKEFLEDIFTNITSETEDKFPDSDAWQNTNRLQSALSYFMKNSTNKEGFFTACIEYAYDRVSSSKNILLTRQILLFVNSCQDVVLNQLEGEQLSNKLEDITHHLNLLLETKCPNSTPNEMNLYAKWMGIEALQKRLHDVQQPVTKLRSF